MNFYFQTALLLLLVACQSKEPPTVLQEKLEIEANRHLIYKKPQNVAFLLYKYGDNPNDVYVETKKLYYDGAIGLPYDTRIVGPINPATIAIYGFEDVENSMYQWEIYALYHNDSLIKLVLSSLENNYMEGEMEERYNKVLKKYTKVYGVPFTLTKNRKVFLRGEQMVEVENQHKVIRIMYENLRIRKSMLSKKEDFIKDKTGNSFSKEYSLHRKKYGPFKPLVQPVPVDNPDGI